MGLEVMHMVMDAIKYALDMFISLLDATGLTNVYLSLFTLLIVVTFLLTPVLGSVQLSDKAIKKEMSKPKKEGK